MFKGPRGGGAKGGSIFGVGGAKGRACLDKSHSLM